MDIHSDSSVLANEISSFFDMTDAPLTEDVEFFVAQLLRNIHIPLGSQKPFWRHIKRNILGDRLFGNKDTTGVDASLIREIEDVLCQFMDVACMFVEVVIAVRVCRQLINFGLGQAVHLAQLAIDGLAAKG